MGEIIIERLCKTYGERVVLRDFSCKFSHGEICCLMAPSGYGKTTLLRILMGLEAADSGCIRGMDGLRISAVFQEDRLCENLDAQANLRLVHPQLKRAEAQALLHEAGLDGCEGQPVRQFSGGMKRRTALMRALCVPGDVLVLDEPFKGLDVDARQRMAECILRHRNGRTTIMVSHDAQDVQALQARLIRMEEMDRIE